MEKKKKKKACAPHLHFHLNTQLCLQACCLRTAFAAYSFTNLTQLKIIEDTHMHRHTHTSRLLHSDTQSPQQSPQLILAWVQLLQAHTWQVLWSQNLGRNLSGAELFPWRSCKPNMKSLLVHYDVCVCVHICVGSLLVMSL